MFGKCGSIIEAESVFLGMSICTLISWSAMLSAYNEFGEAEKTPQLFSKLQGTSVSPNEWIFAIAIQGACCMFAEKNDFLSVRGQKMKFLPLEVGRALLADVRRKGSRNLFLFFNLFSPKFCKFRNLINIFRSPSNIFFELSRGVLFPNCIN